MWSLRRAELAPLLLLALLSLLPACVQRDGSAATSSRRQAVGGSCGPLGYLGCCDGDTLRYCDAGGDAGASAVSTFCPQGCGWNAVFGLYACGGALPQDPGGLPRACPQLDAGAGDGAPDAAGPAVDAALADGSADSQTDPCGGIDYTGCCAGALLRYCVGGQVLVLDCGGANACGWDTGKGFYSCSGKGADPSGQHPSGCPAGSPDASVSKDLGSTDSASQESGIAPDLSADGALADQATLDGSGADGQGDAVVDARGDRAVGLEVSGFDSARSDGRTKTSFGGGGCSCRLASGAPIAGWSWCVLALFVVCLRRRRGRR